MARLPKFDRVLVVVSPHGDYIAEGAKKALVKSRRYHMEDETLLFAPQVINLATFRRLRGRHMVSEEERRRWWPRKTTFYLYEIAEFHPIVDPIAVDYPRGPQVFVRKENLWRR
jgi:hypothetical protein